MITEAAAGQHGRGRRRCPASTPRCAAITAAHGALLDLRRGDDRVPGLAGRLVRPRRPRRAADLFTFGKVMGGGFPAAAFGGRAEVMARWPRPGRSTRRARCPGTRSPPPPGWPRCGCTDDASTPGSTPRPTTIAGAAHRGADRRRACRTVVQRAGQHVRVFFTDRPRCSDYDGAQPQDLRRLHGVLPRHARRAGVYLPPSAFEAWFVSAAHDDDAVERFCERCRTRPERPPAGERDATGSDAPADDDQSEVPPAPSAVPARTVCERGRGSARSGREVDRTVVHLLRHGEVHNPDGILYGRLPGFHLSDLGLQMAERAAGSLPRPGHRLRRRLAAGAGPGDRRARSRPPTGWTSAPTSGSSRPTNVFEGKTFGVGDGALRTPGTGGSCATRSGRPGASRTQQVAARMLAAAARRPGRGRGHEAVLRQPPAADLDRPARGGEPAAVARPAQAAVHAGLADVVSLRGRPDRVASATPSRP